MVKKEVYLKFGNRNKAITFESKAGTSDWKTLREVIQQASEKDEDLKKRLQFCTNIIFQKYKVKKSTGERILVDVNEDEEPEIENDADLAIVFCCFQNILLNSESAIQTQDIIFPLSSQNLLFFDLTNGVLKCKFLKKAENNVMIMKNTNIENAQIIHEMDKEQDQNINSEILNTTIETQESVSKRKLSTKMNLQKNVKKQETLPFDVPITLPYYLCEYSKYPDEIIKHSPQFIRYYATMLKIKLNNEITKEHYKQMAKVIAERHPILADEGDVSYASIRKSLSECVRNLRAREKRKLGHFIDESKEENSVQMASINSIETTSCLQETDKEKQEDTIEEMKNLTENVSLLILKL